MVLTCIGVVQIYSQACVNVCNVFAFKECATCNYVRYRVGPDTQYQVNGKSLPLAKFREAVALVVEPQTEAATVLRHVKRNQVTVVSVYL
jgi:hypothetical protein